MGVLAAFAVLFMLMSVGSALASEHAAGVPPPLDELLGLRFDGIDGASWPDKETAVVTILRNIQPRYSQWRADASSWQSLTGESLPLRLPRVRIVRWTVTSTKADRA